MGDAVTGAGTLAVLVLATGVALRAALTARRRAVVAARTGAGAVGPPSPFAVWVGARLSAVDAEVDPRRAGHVAVTAGVALVAVAMVAGGPGLAAVLLAAGAALVIAADGFLRRLSLRRLEAALPELLESLARSVRSGASLLQALAEAAPPSPLLRDDIDRVASAAGTGLPLVRAIERWAEERPLPSVRLAAAALALGAETGGAQARALDGVAATLRQRLGVAAEVRALATQARASAAVIAVAPLVFGAMAAATDPRTASFLFRTPLGIAFLSGGLALDGVAAVWMARITRGPR